LWHAARIGNLPFGSLGSGLSRGCGGVGGRW
jgi:hypothetical protein